MMSICPICNNDSFHDGICENCGRVYGQIPVIFVHTLGRPNMVITDKYLIFTKGINYASSLSSTMIGAAVGGGIGLNIVDSLNKKKADRLLKQSVGMLDIQNLRKLTMYMPHNKVKAPAIYFEFKNGTDLCLVINEVTYDRRLTNQFMTILDQVGIRPEIRECNKSDEIKAKNPIANKKTLTLTVSASAAEFLTPFKGMIVTD